MVTPKQELELIAKIKDLIYLLGDLAEELGQEKKVGTHTLCPPHRWLSPVQAVRESDKFTVGQIRRLVDAIYDDPSFARHCPAKAGIHCTRIRRGKNNTYKVLSPLFFDLVDVYQNQ